MKALRSFSDAVGDLRDDIADGWGAPGNESIAEELLGFLFDLQNDEGADRIHAVILSGDIHAAGYSNIFSNAAAHAKRPVIPHIVASPVGYEPFNWVGEAIFRKMTVGTVPIGLSGTYAAQISHHFTFRNVVICSVRKTHENVLLKTKFYLEGFPEPQTYSFNLKDSSHLERIEWK